jgi:peptide/nickel transport system substrate-binding protein
MIDLSRRVFLAGSAGAALLPSGARAQQAAPRRGGVLRMSIDQAASVINPLRVRVNPEYLVAELLYSGLTRLSPQMTAEPDLATSWTANAALTEWRFRLHEGVRFHDGSPCTAKDVAATFAAILDP